MVANIFPLSYTVISTWDPYVVVSDPKLWLALKQALLLHSFDVRVALEVAFFPVFIMWPIYIVLMGLLTVISRILMKTCLPAHHY